MNESPAPETLPATNVAVQPETTAAPPAADPAMSSRSLGIVLSESYQAVLDALLKANDYASNLELQLAGKSKEVMHLKFLFEQTKANLTHLQDSIAAMRKDRHKLANEAMRAQGLEIMLKRTNDERDRLKGELAAALEGLAAQGSQRASNSLNFDKKDRQIAELTFELVKLREEAAGLRRANVGTAAAAAPQPAPVQARVEIAVTEPANIEVVPTERVNGARTRG